jgi:murein peptide amidase A
LPKIASAFAAPAVCAHVQESSPIIIDPVAFAVRIQDSATAAGFRVESYGEIAGSGLYGLTKRTRGRRPRIYLSAGIHGDEPAPPLALLDLIERGVLDDRAVWFVCPLLNPVGFLRQTRENAEGLDLNRDYRAMRSLEIQAHARWLQRQPNFDLALCLHEDWEAKGFYLYELNRLQRSSLAATIITEVLNVCPIDPATTIDGRAVSEPGIIRPVDDPQLRELWPESIYLRAHHTRLGYTLETPSSFPLIQRIGAHCAAVEAAVDALVRGMASLRLKL